MHKRLIHISNSNTGMTLMELIVATALVGIVMAGTASVDFAIHNMRKSTSNSANVAIQTSATMLQITSSLAKAVGNAQNLGLAVNNPACTANSPCRIWFCARQDRNNPNTPNTYADDTWVCFWKDPNNTNIVSCTRTIALGPGDCSVAADKKTIGTAACTTTACANYQFTFYLKNDPSTHQFFVDVNLTNYPYPDKALDPLKNPAYQLSSHISPIGHSY